MQLVTGALEKMKAPLQRGADRREIALFDIALVMRAFRAHCLGKILPGADVVFHKAAQGPAPCIRRFDRWSARSTGKRDTPHPCFRNLRFRLVAFRPGVVPISLRPLLLRPPYIGRDFLWITGINQPAKAG
jgi:hypothetical protein